jgi:hypothetical protein
MQTKNPMLDDVAKLATSALGALKGARVEVERLARQQVERMINQMHLVTRDEFDVVKAMAAEARAENERLASILRSLAARLEAGPARSRAASVNPSVKKARKRAKSAA